MNAFEGAQEITHIGPQAFNRITMHFANAVAIVITRPFSAAVRHGGVRPEQMVIALVLIRKDGRPSLREAMYMGQQSFSGGIAHYAQAHLPTLPPNGAQYGRTVIGIGAASTPFVGAATRWVGGVKVLVAFFPAF